MAVNRSSANQKAKFQAEMQAYANSKGVTIPSNLINLYGMMPAGYAASNEIDARSYYTGIAQGRPSFKTPKWAVDNYIKDKPAFYSLVLSDVAYTYFSQGANKNLPFLEGYIKLAAENGVPANKTAEIIASSGNRQQQVLAEFNARNSGKGFASIGPINLTGVGDALNSVFGGLGTVVENAYKGVSNTLAKAEDVVKKEVLPNPIFQVAMAYYMPGIASSLGPYLTAVPAAYQTAVAGALTSTALQVAQGVPFETALKSATVNAITNTGAPKVADYILPYVGSTQVADALTSIGASAAKTAAMGGTKDDIERNMAAALTGSGLTSALQGVDVSRETSRVAGAAAGGAVAGGTTGALVGAAGEISSQQAAKDAALERAKKGLASADTGTVSDSGQQLGDVVVTGEREPTVQDTSIISPDVSVPGRQPDGTVVVTSKRETTPSLTEVTVTGKKEPTTVQDTDITLPETVVTGTPESDVSAEEGKPGKPPVDEQGKYRPSLFIYGGVKPSTLSQSLGTTVERIPSSSTTTGTSVGLGGRGEIESKESGKKRQTVWNEESLRLKDALGL